MSFTENILVAPKLKGYALNSPKARFPYRNSKTELLRESLFNLGNKRKTCFSFGNMFLILKKKDFANSGPLN